MNTLHKYFDALIYTFMKDILTRNGIDESQIMHLFTINRQPNYFERWF